ncbi:MAG TPA: condensation domain-containing protein, partial [Verrucomicrobiae bacterium]|nr:condensation domain-containing protein [Verrucomicrobiae bacterium]
MTEAIQLLASFETQGVVFHAEGGRLQYRAPKGVLTAEARRELSERKEALLAAWRERSAQSVVSHPCSYGQRALWFMHRSMPASAAYNVAFTARVKSAVDTRALRLACQALVDRHPALRTTFALENGQLVQRVHGHSPVHFVTHDRAEMQIPALREEVIRAARAPFDLESGPLLRVELFSRAAEDHVLLLTIHHIAADGWSLFLLLDDLRWLYPAERNGTAPGSARPAQDVVGYARWQKEMLAAQEGQVHEAYWGGALAGELPPLNLPTDRPRPLALTDHGATLPISLDAELSHSIRKLATQENTTTFVVLLAAYQTLLHRWSGQSELVVGSPTYGRDRAEFENVVGDLMNMIPLRAKFHGNPTFREFLAQTKRSVIEGIQHQDYPFSLLVEKLKPARDPSRSPIFQTAFMLQRFKQLSDLQKCLSPSAANGSLDFGGLLLEAFPIPQQEGQFDVSLELLEADGAFQGNFKYNTDLFGAGTIQRLSKDFVEILGSLVRAPETPISGTDQTDAASEGGVDKNPLEVQLLSRDNRLPLSYGQQRLWFMNQLEPDSPAYNIAITLRLKGRLDRETFVHALNSVVERHEVLRSTFVSVDGSPSAVVHPTMRLHVEEFEVPGATFAEREHAAHDWIRDRTSRPMDLENGPLFRPLLVRLSEEEYWLVLLVHHIVADGWSLGVLVGEWAECYQAALAKRAPNLSP